MVQDRAGNSVRCVVLDIQLSWINFMVLPLFLLVLPFINMISVFSRIGIKSTKQVGRNTGLIEPFGIEDDEDEEMGY